MTSAISPEIVDVEILEESPMTKAEEEELVAAETAIAAAYADKLQRNLAIGAGLLQIFRRKLYRGKDGGRKWKDYLKEESRKFTLGDEPLTIDTARHLKGFYQFRCEVLQRSDPGLADLELPASPKQTRPLLSQLNTHPQAAIEIWKAACTDAGKKKTPTFDQVQRAALAHLANENNEARRLSAAQKEQLEAARSKAVDLSIRQADQKRQERDRRDPEPAPEPTVPGWTLQKDDGALDAIEECKEITRAINKAHEAVGLLRGILYKRISVHGRDYMGFLRQVDAGVYSLSTIDHEVRQIGEDVDFVLALLVADVGEGELSQATVDLSAIPTRDG
tara:strand:+ start:180 stop:1181 length:1002 start_codon:yes stop_codon:yes gene_type:complete